MMQSLCTTCRFVRAIRTVRSCFLLCQRSKGDAQYPKYPAQPVRRCGGYEEAGGSGEEKREEDLE
jgi:hypothetical protein